MERSKTPFVLLFVVPMVACDSASDAPPADAPAVAAAVAAELVEDPSPAGGKRDIGYDLTELARKQNEPGREPALPTQVGRVTPAAKLPNVVKTANGFAAQLPGANNVPTPAYYRGHVLTGGFGTHELHALDPKTGRPAWSLELSDDGPTAPACKDGVCVFNTYSCTVFSVAAATGKHLWSWWLGSPQLATPVIFGDTVYTSYPGQGGPEGAPFVIAAFRLKTGEPLWRRWIDAEVNDTPVAHDGKLYVATMLGTLYELGANDGNVLAVRHNRVASPPVITGDGAFFAREVLPHENDMLATVFTVLDDIEPKLPIMPAQITPKPRPLVAAHRLVTVEEGVVVASHRKTGSPLWQRRLDDGAATASSPILYAGGSLLIASANGKILRLHEDTGDVMATFDLGQVAIASQPIVHEGWIYTGTTDGKLVGHDTGEPELTGWDMLGGGPERLNVANPEDS